MKLTMENIKLIEDLIQINRDRVEAYKRASYDTSVSDLKEIFSQMADESRKNITDLLKEIINANQPVKEVADDHEVYSDWKDIPLKFIHRDSNTFLNLCEYSESAILTTYDRAITALQHTSIYELVKRQEESLKSSLETIRSYRKVYIRVI